MDISDKTSPESSLSGHWDRNVRKAKISDLLIEGGEVGPPQGTPTRTADDLARAGFVGIYKCGPTFRVRNLYQGSTEPD